MGEEAPSPVICTGEGIAGWASGILAKLYQY